MLSTAAGCSARCIWPCALWIGTCVLVPLQGAAARCVWVCALEPGCWRCCRALPPEAGCSVMVPLQGAARNSFWLFGVYAGVILPHGLQCRLWTCPHLRSRSGGRHGHTQSISTYFNMFRQRWVHVHIFVCITVYCIYIYTCIVSICTHNYRIWEP